MNIENRIQTRLVIYSFLLETEKMLISIFFYLLKLLRILNLRRKIKNHNYREVNR